MVRVRATEVYLGIEDRARSGRPFVIGLPSPVALIPTPDSAWATWDLWKTFRDDLLVSRLVDLVEGGPNPLNGRLDIPAWGAFGAEGIAVGEVRYDSTNTAFRVQFTDLSSGNTVFDKTLYGKSISNRALAHQMSRALLQMLTGEGGVAGSKIAFVSFVGGAKEIFVVDADGSNLRQLTHDGSIALLPKWSPDGTQLLYTSYKDFNPDLYVFDSKTGQTRAVSQAQGLNTAGTWMPDGKEIILTLSRGGNSDLYRIGMDGKIRARLTRGRGIQTSPTVSPTRWQLAYTSDVTGSPNIYVMDLDGSRRRTITFGKWCDSAVWSPSGEYLAFACQERNAFNIFRADPEGRRVERLTQGVGRNTNPTWSPDGRMIAFVSNRAGKRELYLMGSDGSDPRRLIEAPGPVFTPSWGK